MIGIAHTCKNKINAKAKRAKKEQKFKHENTKIQKRGCTPWGLIQGLEPLSPSSLNLQPNHVTTLKKTFLRYTHLCEVRLELRSALFLTDTQATSHRGAAVINMHSYSHSHTYTMIISRDLLCSSLFTQSQNQGLDPYIISLPSLRYIFQYTQLLWPSFSVTITHITDT